MPHLTLVLYVIGLWSVPVFAQVDENAGACATREASLAEMKKDESLAGLAPECLDEVARDAKVTGEASCFEDQFRDLSSVTNVVKSSGVGINNAANDLVSAYRQAAIKNQTQKNNCDFYYNRIANTCTSTRPEAVLKAFDDYSKCSDYRMRQALWSANQSGSTANAASTTPKYQREASMLGVAKVCYLAACLLQNGADVTKDMHRGVAAQPQVEDVEQGEAPALKVARPRPSSGPPTN